MPRLAVVIPVHNRRAISLACLERLRQLPQAGFELKLYVVDDGSQDGTGAAIREAFPEVCLLQGDGTLWWSGAMNLGIEAALQDGAEYLLSLNDDTSFEAGLLPALLKDAQQKPRSLWSPLGVHEDGGDIIYSGYRYLPWKGWSSYPKELSQAGAPYRVEGLPGACVLFPAALIAEIGPYEAKRLPQDHADIEFSARAGRRGWEIWIDPRLKLGVLRNLRNVDLLRGDLKRESLGNLFAWPRGPFAPRAFFAFYALSHPRGPLFGLAHASFAYAKLFLKMALNVLGFGRPR